jgi:hypothetical protein
MRIKFIGRGTYYRQITEAIGNYRISSSHIAVNFGLQGDNLRDYRRRFPAIDRLPMLNSQLFGNKYECVTAASTAGVPVPRSWRRGDVVPADVPIIRKPYYSLGGRDIERHSLANDTLPDTHYLQEEITNRRYEVRVHAMAWVNPNQWVMQKRIHPEGDEQLTWNHHTGGTFVTIEDTTNPLFERIRQSVITLTRTLGYQFGAVDFIVTSAGERGRPLPHYFIEWNLAPGWTLDRIRNYYISSFRALSDMTMDQVHQMLESGVVDGAPSITVTEEPPDTQMGSFMNEGEMSAPILPTEREPITLSNDVFTPEQIAAMRAQQEADTAAQVLEDSISVARVSMGQPSRDDTADYEAHMQEMAEEVNFCHNCGRPISADIFGAVPRFCRGCGTQVRA